MKQELKKLKAAAHHLKPVIILGNQGLTPGVHNEIEVALEAHELIKIRVNAGDKAERDTLINDIIEKHNATLVQRIGHVVTIYRAAKQSEES